MYKRYFKVGDGRIPLHDTRWVPQGLARVDYNTLAISYYDSEYEKDSIVTLFTTDGRYLAELPLLGMKANKDYHGVGGIAMTDKYFWVTDNGKLFRYPASVVRAKRNAHLKRNDFEKVKGKASYLGVEVGSDGPKETLWVGNFNLKAKDLMYQYNVKSDGSLEFKQSRRTPAQVQGVVVTHNRFIWSTSFCRNEPGRLIVWPRSYFYDGSSSIGNFVKAPNMIEGIVYAGDRLRAVFESSSDKYNGTMGGSKADVIVRSIQHGSIPPVP